MGSSQPHAEPPPTVGVFPVPGVGSFAATRSSRFLPQLRLNRPLNRALVRTVRMSHVAIDPIFRNLSLRSVLYEKIPNIWRH